MSLDIFRNEISLCLKLRKENHEADFPSVLRHLSFLLLSCFLQLKAVTRLVSSNRDLYELLTLKH
jgi:hypothetical protein